ncbi:putative protein kinase RLK-Pelle-SD-2b family [Helianthus debilis subsp. tardiflorus]
MRSSTFFFAFLLILMLCCYSPIAQLYPTTKPSTTWTTNYSAIQPMLLRQSDVLQFTCGFLCEGNCTSYIFAIFISPVIKPGDFKFVWLANRDYPVRENAVLNFTAAGDLVLKDVDGRIRWSTNTAGKGVAGMNLTDTGNLVLFDDQNLVVWQSFDHPANSLLVGQKLFEGQKLKSSVSVANSSEGLYSLQLTDKGVIGYVESNPPQVYYSMLVYGKDTNKGRRYMRFLNGSLSFFIESSEPSDHPHYVIDIPQASSTRYIKLMPDGRLNVYGWPSEQWLIIKDLTTVFESHPTANHSTSWNTNYSDVQSMLLRETIGAQFTCGFLCEGNCTDHSTPFHYIFAIFISPTTKSPGNSRSVWLANRDYPVQENAVLNFTAAGDLVLKDVDGSTVWTTNTAGKSVAGMNLTDTGNLVLFDDQNSVVWQSFDHPAHSLLPGQKLFRGQKLKSSVSDTNFSEGFIMYRLHKRKRDVEMEEEYLDQVPGMPNRFSYEELKNATANFSKKLGEGGYGSVFKGTLGDGTEIAVKCLEGLAHVKKSFLAEVQSIGSIHHVNLVRLRGFCTWKTQRFLVYDFMSNGSLDKWIYGVQGQILEWACRKTIILDIAKGLAYLHEECRQKIVHLDIKPQNILLDNDFNAKVSDFGLSKLIDKGQTEVMTNIKGTPGYIAPEWRSSIITEKLDVYSFGIVLLEILCGRKIFDRSQPEDNWYLLAVFQKCWEEGTLLDMVDKQSEDMQVHKTEVMEMMNVAAWCLQTNFRRRPSMSSVVKVLEGGLNVEPNLDHNFTDPSIQEHAVGDETDFTLLSSSILSAPR